VESGLYVGRLRHRRSAPVDHVFSYGLFMIYLDLAELPRVFRGNPLWSADRPAPAWFRSADHLGGGSGSLDESVRDLVESRTGARPAGPIRLLTHVRTLGYVFNPVSFYYCFDVTGRVVDAIVAEVNNTPWGERHCYVLPRNRELPSSSALRFRFPKEFHVSPFMGMGLEYDWRFTRPGPSLAAHMMSLEAGRPIFDATLTLRRREITGSALTRVLLEFPAMTARVIAAIHWQALRLWLKRVPFRPHPRPEARWS
jgi:DUF1365 family protein